MRAISIIKDLAWKLISVRVMNEIRSHLLTKYLVYGREDRVQVAESAVLNNALLNTSSGTIRIGENVFFGHNVCILTGTHDVLNFGYSRMQSPDTGRDIVIEEGVWVATNATILGPCTIGKHSVIAAGAVVTKDVDAYAVVAGVPARTLRVLEHRCEKNG